MSDIVRSGESKPRRGLLGDDLDSLFEGFFRPMRSAWRDEEGGLVPAVDVSENDTQYTVKADLPGVSKEDIDVSINDDVLTINAETKQEQEKKDAEGRIIRQERRYGKYVRSMRLGGEIDAKRVEATYSDGVLKLVLPKLEQAKPRKVDVVIK